MKTIAVHNNSSFFKSKEEGGKNFYQFLAEKRGEEDEHRPLAEEYKERREKGPLLMKETYDLCVAGLTPNELDGYVQEYYEAYARTNVRDLLESLKNAGHTLLIFTSYPSALYRPLQESGLVDAVFAPEPVLDEEGIITGFQTVSLTQEEAVKQKMAESNTDELFTKEPNRYGMLEYFLEFIMTHDISKGDVIVVGMGTTSEPLHPYAGEVVENLEEVEM